MKIQELLKKLNEKYPKRVEHYFMIFHDGSGSIRYEGEDSSIQVIDFESIDMEFELTKLWDELNDQTKQWKV